MRNIFGAAVGDPVIKNKLFYFLNCEGRRDSQGTSVNAGVVPTQSYRDGFLKYRYVNSTGGDSIYTLSPSDIQNMDPQGIGNEAALLQVLNNYPQGNDPTQGDGLNSIGYRFPYTIHRKYDTYIGRIDWNPGSACIRSSGAATCRTTASLRRPHSRASLRKPRC
ncbi:MAG TPA: hypothetical protein VIJ38_15165 [Acidobacteriaceae bacterium]